MKEWTLDLVGFLPMSQNKRERCHWTAPRMEKQKALRSLAILAREQKIPRATGKRAVKIVLFKGPRGKRDDPGNVGVRTKAILDCLVDLGILIDDSDEHLDYRGVEQVISSDPKCTRVEVRDLGSG